MTIIDSVISLAGRAVVAAGVVISANVGLTVFGVIVPLDINAAIQMLLSTGILYKFVQEVLNEFSGVRTTDSSVVGLGDKLLPF